MASASTASTAGPVPAPGPSYFSHLTARGIPHRPSASDLAARDSSPQSPLDQLTSGLRPAYPSPRTEAARAQPPPLDLNLFRSSVYSVDSASSLDDDSDLSHSEDHGSQPPISPPSSSAPPPPPPPKQDEEESDDSPATPRAGRTGTHTPAEETGATTPTRGFVVRSRIDSAAASASASSSTPTKTQRNGTFPSAGPSRATPTSSIPPPKSAITKQPFELRPVPSPRSRTQSSPNTPATGSVPFPLPKPYPSPNPNTQSFTHPAHPAPLPSLTLPRPVPAPAQVAEAEVPTNDWASVHGEQGSDWGEDEAEFEWLDTDEPEAVNGEAQAGGGGRKAGLAIGGLSPSKRFSKLKAAVKSSGGSGGSIGSGGSGSSGGGLQSSGSRRLKKPLVLPRRAAPPPPRDGIESPPPPPVPKSPVKGNSASHPSLKFGAGQGTNGERLALAPRWAGNTAQQTTPNHPQGPPGHGHAGNPNVGNGLNVDRDVFGSNRSLSMPHSSSSTTLSTGAPMPAPGMAPGPTLVVPRPQPLPISSLPPRTTTLGSLMPTSVPMKDHDGPSGGSGSSSVASSPGPGGGGGERTDSRQSHFSVQSLAYSFYDLGPSSSTPTPRPGEGKGDEVFAAQQGRAGREGDEVNMAKERSGEGEVGSHGRERSGSASATGATGTQGSNGSAFPRGTYTKVSASKLDRDANMSSTSNSSFATTSTITVKSSTTTTAVAAAHEDHRSSADLVALGLQARAAGDLPRSAWLFVTAAEKGSAAGRMYYGMALRHGWGVAKDEKKGCGEMVRACEKAIAQGGLGGGGGGVGAGGGGDEKKGRGGSEPNDLAVGLAELGNCFLQGAGVKKSPEVGMQYLRMAATLGDVASQEQLGALLAKGGHGVKKEMKEAAKWYRLAATQGSGNTVGLAWIWKEKYND